MKVSLQIFNPQKTMARILDDSVGIFAAETWARYINPYVPMRDGFLSQNYTTESNKIIYNQLYAKRNYYGDDFNFLTEQHPLATSHWERPAYAAKKDQVAKEITEFIKRR